MLIKAKGQVFTPVWIVNYILDNIEYKEKIYNKKILEPSCGTGNFLEEIIKRFIKDCQNHNINNIQIINLIKKNIFAFEIDENLRNIAVNRINNLIKNLLEINFDFSNNIILDNALFLYKKYINYFDYIVGNPPYVKIQNLDENTKNYIQNNLNFTTGNTDLYIAFFEISLKMLKENGKLGFITPNSYFKNHSNKNFRNYLIENRLIKKIVNFLHYKIFDNFSTYTAITILNKKCELDNFEYYEYNGKNIIFKKYVKYKNLENIWNFQDRIYINKNNYKLSDYYQFLNGFATLSDNIFIKEKNDKILTILETELLYPILKASKMKEKIVIFPYKVNKELKLIKHFNEEELKKNYPNIYNYFLQNKEKLLNRNLRNKTEWFEFGRTQALKYCLYEKVAISTIFYDKIKYKKLNGEVFVYSGLFAIKKKKISWDFLFETFENQNFTEHLKGYSKHMSGGYYSISSRILNSI